MAERTKDILKTISMFDVDKDFEDREAREKLANLFRDLILNPEPDAKDFFAIFSEKISDILNDLDVTEEEPTEEDPSGDDPVGVQDDEVEDIPEDDDEETDEETEDDTEEEDEEIPDELMDNMKYTHPIIERANRFIYN